MSLLYRLQDRDNDQAWLEFLKLYEPLLRRVVRSSGIHSQDTGDAVQEILLSVYRAIPRYEAQGHNFAFRGWLSKIARNAAINFLERRSSKQVSGGTSIHELVSSKPDSNEHLEALWEAEYRKSILELAASNVSKRVAPKTFAAFWRTFVEGASVEEVSRELSMSAGSIYVARGRVMAIMQAEMKTLLQQEGAEE